MAADKGKGGAVNYDDMKAKLKEFLAGYHKVNDRGQKEFVYARQITEISHREQVTIKDGLWHSLHSLLGLIS